MMQPSETKQKKNQDFGRLLSEENFALNAKVLQILLDKKLLSAPEVIERIQDKLQRKTNSRHNTDSLYGNFAREELALQDAILDELLTSPKRLEIIRYMPMQTMLRQVVAPLLASDGRMLSEIMPLMGVLLQYTNAFNFSILCKIKQLRTQSRAMIQQMVDNRETHMAEALVRCMVAQPYVIELIDAGPLFKRDPEQMQDCQDTFELLVCHLRELVYPTIKENEVVDNKNIRLDLVQTLLLNKHRENRLKAELETQLSDSVIQITGDLETSTAEEVKAMVMEDGTVIAQSAYMMEKVERILQEIEERPFGHFVIRGPAGSGKMTLLRLADHLMKSRQSQQSEPQVNRFIVVTLEETFDSKNLVGTYVCSETGEFVFKKGPLTVAAEQGLWLVLRNIEDTPSDLLSFLLPLVQQNTLQVTSTFAIKPRLGFRIFALTKTQSSHQFLTTQEETIQPLLTLLKQTNLDSLMPEARREDLESILRVKFSPLFTRLQIGTCVHSLLQRAIFFIQDRFTNLKLHLLDYKPTSVTQMFSLYERITLHLGLHLENQGKGDSQAFLSQGQRQLIIEEIHDVYLAYMYDLDVKRVLIRDLVSEVFNTAEESTLDGQIIAQYITNLGREHGSSNEQSFFGRATLQRTIPVKQEDHQKALAGTSKFVYTGATVRSLEQICQSARLSEALLLVGETGTGKTTIVQELAKLMGKKLHVFNMNQNTDSADLLGGFKSVDLKYLLKPIYGLFLEVFSSLLNKEASSNQKFLDILQKTFEQNKINDFIQCLNHGMKSIKRAKNCAQDLQTNVVTLERQIQDLQKRAKKLASGGGFIFQFVEGTLIKSIQEGDWILLDEINLASDSVLNKLATIVQGTHILLNERADIIETKRHKDFLIFMCMNPPYSSAGKKQLPLALRSKLTEIYVNELDNEADLWDIIDRNTKSLTNENVSCISEGQKRQILEFYIKVKSEVQKQMRRGNIGLRNLCRALFFIKSAVQLRYPAMKAIYDSLLTCFASHLDQQLQESVRQMIMKLFEIKKLPSLTFTEETKDDRFAYVEGNIIKKGDSPPQNFDELNFILTPSFKGLLRQLASIVAVSDFAVILEGPTSAGKTSCVQYLADVTQHKVIRINNHMHTDVQEYLGSYVPDADGKLVFQEGVLVEAVRNGHWVILDELNLAPSEVLEALNRLLDDNRELNIVETQTVVKAHPRFRIFATQNPTEGYGGRKELSEAFKNRFVLIRVLDVPTEELEEILVKKCCMPVSRASLMIKVMESLQIYRSQANLFSGKNAIITVRDLLKWAGRVNLNNQRGTHMDPHNIAMEGFFVLGERSRNTVDKLFIQSTIEKVFNVKLDIEAIYETYFSENLQNIFDRVPAELNLPKIIPSKQLKRLAVLVAKCLKNREPVLLVGETGCGKTTLCQVFASEVTHQTLMQINCHQNTETSDFIGCMRTRKNLKQTQDKLELLLETNACILNDEDRELFNRARTLKRKTKILLNGLRDTEHIQIVSEVKSLKEDLNCVFEWHDGILVDAMQQGGLLLIDEISLANDSVLERLNSVFEADRVLMVTEKSSQEALKIVAHEKFNMVATMNPSGDFGKKELSPALRNRMTEIWVESYFQQEQLLEIIKKTENQVVRDVTESVDLFLIISKLCEDRAFPSAHQKAIALAIFNMISFLASFNQSDSTKFQALKRKSLSIRDILCIIDFMSKNLARMPLDVCFKEAIELVIIDGICLGIDTAGLLEQEAIVKACHHQLSLILTELFAAINTTDQSVAQLTNNSQYLGVSHYAMSKKEGLSQESKFAFDAATTQTNLMKLLRAYTLGKPILIEGPPGVGKTALVEQVARVTGRKLVRVNLSEQTDMMDLLGSEYPTSANAANGAKTGDFLSDEEDHDEIQFRWGDGVLLSAIKEGHWLLIDEMNLAQQSILEGLNAVLDHRRTVYIPELNREFQCHPDFFVFACQNPSQSSSSTSGRKTLPKSFLNRFTKIYLSELTNEDYRVILRSIAGDIFPSQAQIDWLLTLTQEIEGICATQTYQALGVNMRDLSRFIRVYKQALFEQASPLQALLHAFNSTYLMKEGVTESKRRQCLQRVNLEFCDQAHQEFSPYQQLPFTASVRVEESHGLVFEGLLRSSINFVQTNTPEPIEVWMADFLSMKGSEAAQTQALSDCLRVGLPILITTNDPTKMVQCLTLMARVQNSQLRRILLSDRSDTTQLLGCFEQTSQDVSVILRQLQPFKKQLYFTQSIMDLERQLMESPIDLQTQVKLVEEFLNKHTPIFDQLRPMVTVCKRGVSRFEWVDSVLVKAITDGEWAVFENANICNPSILDRLNPLLEEGNQTMVINEQGLNDSTQTLRTVKAHESFRAIFVLSQKSLVEQGRDVSRALRNRCVQLSLTFVDALQELCLLADKNSLADLASEQLDARNMDWSLSHLQTQFDLLPCQNLLKSSIAESDLTNGPILGKRQRREIESQEITALTSKPALIAIQEPEAYPYIYLEHAKAMPGSESAKKVICSSLQLDAFDGNSDGWQLYMRSKIAQIQAALKLRMSREIVTKQLQPFFSCLLASTIEDCCDLESLHYLMTTLLKSRGLSSSFDSSLSVYLASRIKNKMARDAICGSEGLASELNFLFTNSHTSSDSDFEVDALRALAPNAVSEDALSCYLEKGLSLANVLGEQKVFMFKASVSRLIQQLEIPYSDIASGGRVALTMLMLSGDLDDQPRKATVIMLNEEKEILSKEQMIKDLEDLDDPAQVLETPNLVVIPFDQASKSIQGVVTSQSFLYESLCDLKDWMRVQAGKTQQSRHFRLTKIPLATHLLQKDDSQVLANQITLMARPVQKDEKTHSFEDRLMQAVLIDEKTICVRDLPAFYACATSLMYKLDDICSSRGRQETRFADHFRVLHSKITASVDLRDDLMDFDRKLQAHLHTAFDSLTTTHDYQCLADLAKESKAGILQSLELIWSVKTESIIHSLIILPLEVARLTNSLDFAELGCQSYSDFYNYHLRCPNETNRLLGPKKAQQARISDQIRSLKQLQAESGSRLSERQQNQLRPLLAFTNNLLGEVRKVQSQLASNQADEEKFKDIRERCDTIISLLQSSTQLLLPMFNNIVSELFSGCLNLVTHVRQYCLALHCIAIKASPNSALSQCVVNLTQSAHGKKTSMLHNILRVTSQQQRDKELNEKSLLWGLKLTRLLLTQETQQRSTSLIFEYFVRREVAKKMAEERARNEIAEQVFHVPFKQQNQSIPDCVGKAMDEWTKEDVARMKAEAEAEIEANFPSYFDEVQKQFYSGELTKDYSRDAFGKYQKTSVPIETVFAVFLGVTKSEDPSFLLQCIKERVEVVKLTMQADKFEQLKSLYGLDSLLSLNKDFIEPQWQEDTSLLLRKMLSSSQPKQIMNISEVSLNSSYNFYHDAYPEEARIVYEPMQNLLIRLRDIVIRDEYESPLLNESLFLANYIITCFNCQETPLMKFLTAMDFLLTKLEEWETTYASKRLNSVETEINVLKMLIIRYRKIQILSWRNLLSWRKDKMIREDVMECCRLAHTLERQVFDLKLYKKESAKGAPKRVVLLQHKNHPQKKGTKLKVDNSIVQERSVIVKDTKGENQSIEAKVFELLDLFIRDSSLGVYQSRLLFIDFMKKHFAYKLENQCARQPDFVKVRLAKVINVLEFIYNYYAQFQQKLRNTVERLDSEARTKVKTLIDVRKWTVQKFTMVKNNIDKTHRQLNQACKKEEEALIQNVQSLVIASSRKKYATNNDQLLSLHKEDSTIVAIQPILPLIQSRNALAKQLAFLTQHTFVPLLPCGSSLAEATEGFMERLSEVRAVNKKHIQVRAYYDLLRFMKAQGLKQSSFNPTLEIQQYLIDQELADPEAASKAHFFRAFETYTMLQSASQVDDQSHIKNVEVRRMQSFSRSMMLSTLVMNKSLAQIKKVIEALKDFKPLAASQENDVDQSDHNTHLTEAKIAQLRRAVTSLHQLFTDTKDKLSLLSLQDTNDIQDLTGKKVTLSGVVTKLESNITTLNSLNVLNHAMPAKLATLLEEFQTTITLEVPSKHMRVRLICKNAISRATEIRIDGLGDSDLPQGEDALVANEQSSFEKLVKQTENLVKLCIQKLVTSFKALQEEDDRPPQRKLSNTAENSVINLNPEALSTTPIDNEQSFENRRETSIEQMTAYSKSFSQVLADPMTSKLNKKIREVFALKGVTTLSESTRVRIENTYEVLQQLNHGLAEAMSRVDMFLRSMMKFSFLSQRVFIHLIYQGFCGQEDEDDPDVEPPSDLEEDGEQDGCGLGDGKGGKENITDQIEHEEQLEGLKNYESDQEEEEDEEKQDKNDKEDDDEDDNDFEMKNDFDGDMDSEPEEEKPQDKKEDDEDDELDKVDDMLDNQLWDQNMEDMEQKEKEEAEKEEQKEQDKEEVDLGDRELDEHHLLPQNKDDEHMAEGDREEQDQADQQEDRRQNEEMEQSAAASEEDDKNEGERDQEQSEEENEEIPLDKNSVLADEDEKFSEEAKSDKGEDSEPDPNAEKEDTDEVDSKFDEDNNQPEEDGSQDDEAMDDEEDIDVQQNPDQAILDDDQIQAKENQNEDEKDKDQMDQANLKRQDQKTQDQKKKPENKQNQADDKNQVSQADQAGSDLLFEMAKQFQKRQEQKQQQRQDQKRQQEKEDKSKAQVEQPQMVPEDVVPPEEEKKQPQPEDRDMDNNEAAEYVFDDKQADMIQGKLATDHIEEEDADQNEVKEEGDDGQLPEDMPMDEEKSNESAADELNEEKLERTQAQFKETGTLKPDSNEQNEKDEEDKEMDDAQKEESKENPRDLVDEYEAYLQAKTAEKMDLDNGDDSDGPDRIGVVARFTQNLEQFDYMEQKLLIRNRFQDWIQDEQEHTQALKLLAKFRNQTQSVSSSLCEQLRIVLEPQLSQNLQGDFKTGKRLNMKKVISFIASHYRNDKIWLRRTLPSKRDYKILIAIDDSMSMRESNQGFFSLEAMIALTEALNRLEVGQVAVARIRDRMDLVHSFDDTYTSEKAGFIVSQFRFEHQAPTSADYAMANFVGDANKLLDMQNGGNTQAVNCPFVIVLSDGRFNKDNVRRYIREAKEKRYLYIFVILDKQASKEQAQIGQLPNGKSQAKSQSILNMRSAIKTEGSRSMKLVPYLRDFPFDYYCIVSDTSELPNALGTILVQWFSMVSASGGLR